MGPLTIQIMILVASFLFYRILKSGFDSWKAVLIDFGIVIFLFGLQYYLQKKQKNNSEDQSMFPAGPLSSFFNVTFPSKIALKELQPPITPISTMLPDDPHSVPSSLSLSRPSSGPYGCHLQLKESLFMVPKQKKILHFENKIDNQVWTENRFHIKDSGFYIIQMTCDVDTVSYSAKLSLRGNQNEIDKIVHDGENSFVIYLKGDDEIYLELENLKNNIMIQDTTTIYIVKL